MAGGQLSAAEIEFYRKGWRRRREEDRRAVQERTAHALQGARQAADILRREFGATRVVLFGSLAQLRFRMRSDIDIAVWGILVDRQADAARAVELVCSDIELNLVFAESVRPRFLAEIERTGSEL